MRLTTELVLASRSPRRRHLLEQIGIPFSIEVSDTDETIPAGVAPPDVVRGLALAKAMAVAPRHAGALTLGADTIVVLDGTLLGKPADPEEASTMLRRLSGRTHTVYTGLALVHPRSDRKVTAYEATHVTFAPMTDGEIDSYVATGSPMDKAGAYGIQDDRGALFVSRIDGDYYNVVGLPLHRLYSTLKQAFPDLIHIGSNRPE